VIAAIIGFAVILPKLYWTAFEKPIRAPFIMYSCVENDFMIRRTGERITWENRNADKLTQDEFESKLPLLYVRQLLISNTLPDSINGVKMNTHIIGMNNSSFRIRPADLNRPAPKLYPLFESRPGRANLQMPDDFFRITWRMEFLEAETNKIAEEKSRKFSAALFNQGFKFPAKSINGIPLVRKSCDEGYLVVDSENQLFHVKMENGEPYVKKVVLSDNLTFKQISCVDFQHKKYYAYLFSTDNNLYILTQDDYELIKLPVEDVDPAKNQVQIFGDLFHYNIIVTGDNFMTSYVLDTEYNKVDEYFETWPGKYERTEGKVFRLLFPGQISMTHSHSGFVNFFPEINAPFYWLAFSLALLALQSIIIKQKKQRFKNHITDLIIVGFTGVFGFLAVNIFPNKFFDEPGIFTPIKMLLRKNG
jgi:hypothetical protein